MTVEMNSAWTGLEALYSNAKGRKMLDLFEDDSSRADNFQCTTGDMLFDYSKTNIDKATQAALLHLADVAQVSIRCDAMFDGAVINETEGRAVLHTALRNLDGDAVFVDGVDVIPEVRATLDRICLLYTSDAADE